jgi:hypothetical protein
MLWLLFSHGKTPGTHSTGGCMDPRRILNTMEKTKISVYCQEKKSTHVEPDTYSEE